VSCRIKVATSFSTTSTVDVDYVGAKAGLSTTFTASLEVESSYRSKYSVTGPTPPISYYRQDVVIPTIRGKVFLPTTHVVGVERSSDLKDGDFVKLESLGAIDLAEPAAVKKLILL